MKLIWCANFSPRLQGWSIADLIKEVIKRCLPGEAKWPQEIKRTLTYLFNHVVHESNWILLTELVH